MVWIRRAVRGCGEYCGVWAGAAAWLPVLAVSVSALVLGWPAVAGADLLASGRLSASDAVPGAYPLFGAAAMSGGVAVAGEPGATVGSSQRQGAVYLFSRPASGWSSESENAKLVESGGRAGDQFGGVVAMSGGTVVAGRSLASVTGPPAIPGMALPVFTEPAGGWSGTVQESAQLIPADPAAGDLQALAISGDTIVASSDGSCGCNPTVDVFTKPPGGWSGTIHESARLSTPNSSSLCLSGQSGVAIDARTIAAACPSAVYVFTEPASGWTGAIQPSATLPAPSNHTMQSVAVLRSSVVAGLTGTNFPRYYAYPSDPVVFDKPAKGWAGTIRPAATLKVSRVGAQEYDEFVVGSGNEIAAVAMPQSDMCPAALACYATLYAFSQPPGRWKGTIAGSSTPIFAGSTVFPFAIDGPTIATGGVPAIDLFTVRPGSPSAHSVSLSGVAAGAPKLRFTLHAGLNAPPIRSIKLSLPSGLGFAGQRPGRTVGMHINVPFRTARARPDTLTIRLGSAAQNLAVTITRPAIIEQQNLRGKAQRIRRYNRTHNKRSLTITIRLVVTDNTNHNTRLTLKTRVR